MINNRLFVFFAAVIFSLTIYSCGNNNDDDDNNNNNNNQNEVGELDVYVHMSLPTGVLWGYAWVRLYLSEEDRNNNITYDSNITIGETPFNAYFDNLQPQTYYLKANFEHQGDQYEGKSQLFVPKNTKTSHHITATKK